MSLAGAGGQLTGQERVTAGLLFLTLMLVVFPMEQPGMLGVWHGTEPNPIFETKVLRLTIVEVLLGSSLAFAMLSHIGTRRLRYRNNFGPFIWLFLLGIVWGYMGSVFGPNPAEADTLGTGNWKKLFYGLVAFSAVGLFVDTRAKVRTTLFLVCAACLLLDIYGLYKFAFFGGIPTEKYIGRVVFWETSKLALNVLSFAISAGILFLGKEPLSRTEKIVYRGVLICALLVIFMSSRRTSMIMGMIVGAYVWVRMIRARKTGQGLVIAIGAFIAVSLVVVLNFQAFETKFLSRIESIKGVYVEEVEVDAGSTRGHVEEIELGWEIVKKHPVWGVGFFWEEPSDIQDAAGRFWVHNSLLTFWMRFGIIGALMYLYFYFKVLSVLWRSQKHEEDPIAGILFIWFFVEFLSGFMFPPFFGYFKMSALVLGSAGLANGYLNVLAAERAEESGREAAKVVGGAAVGDRDQPYAGGTQAPASRARGVYNREPRRNS